jgi:hypothetical protein
LVVNVQDRVFQMRHRPCKEDVAKSSILSYRYGNLNQTSVATMYASIRPSGVAISKTLYFELDATVSVRTELHVNAHRVSVAETRLR